MAAVAKEAAVAARAAVEKVVKVTLRKSSMFAVGSLKKENATRDVKVTQEGISTTRSIKNFSGRNRRTRATAPTHPDEPTAHRSAQARPQKPHTQQVSTTPTQPLSRSTPSPLTHHLGPRAHAAGKARLMPSACRISDAAAIWIATAHTGNAI